MKKQEFKKVALKGMAAGMLLASQASAHQLTDVNGYSNVLAANCGGAQQPGSMPQSNCGGMTAWNSNPPPASCSGQGAPNGYTAYNMPSQGCGNAAGKPPTKYYYTDHQGKWREGQPPAEYTNQDINPNQDQRIDPKTGQPMPMQDQRMDMRPGQNMPARPYQDQRIDPKTGRPMTTYQGQGYSQ